ncbi:hypothetical protein, partial [Mesorhizobium sp. M8A.F.Ca.ET.213.01.1.1]|uniref:hypothetical protein n=1 Tax=Mesorhizobium sp. M8A.F.Ca.ET.213.01.1.1 TaxID=2563970 RepID=UPI001AEEB4CE
MLLHLRGAFDRDDRPGGVGESANQSFPAPASHGMVELSADGPILSGYCHDFLHRPPHRRGVLH